ncbi:laccase [Lentinula aciculospora]|uniref:Laccase n=1 Tax=Lentinula aciculospora TaxID=153920 RepID=A0A9W9DIJ1_9AGAR|nr:laccase [Lentinula aciculospora]
MAFRSSLILILLCSFVALGAATTSSVNARAIDLLTVGSDTDLAIVNSIISPDGFPRSAVLAGGTFPGPLIVANKGDHFRVNVINQLTDDSMLKVTSIHWHGFFQKGSTWADGVSFVSQCPVVPGNSFLYEFDVPDQAGSFWYHSHMSVQYCDGLRGPIVVYDPDDPYKDMYDVDDATTVITLADWYHLSASQLALLPPPPLPNATLINGLGRHKDGPPVPLAVVNVEYGKRYRFRVIAMSCQPSFNLSIDEHDMTVIETDGEYTRPHTVSSVTVFAGQRYSVIVSATQPVNNYAIRANPSTGNSGFDGGINMAILRYNGASESDPDYYKELAKDSYHLQEIDLHALVNPAAPGEPHVDGADVNINMLFDTDAVTGDFTINGKSWYSPTIPVLLQILSGAQSAADLIPKGSLYPLPLNKSIQLTFSPGTTAVTGPHPFHLHGHSFSVIRSAGSYEYNYVDPVRRDVVSTGAVEDNVTIRFVTDNSGPWFLHCHVDWHLNEGFAVVLAEDVADMNSEVIPGAWKDLCPIYDSLAPEKGDGTTADVHT